MQRYVLSCLDAKKESKREKEKRKPKGVVVHRFMYCIHQASTPGARVRYPSRIENNPGSRRCRETERMHHLSYTHNRAKSVGRDQALVI